MYDMEDEENHCEFTCQSDMTCDDKGCHLCSTGFTAAGPPKGTTQWRLTDSHTQYGILLRPYAGRHSSHDQQQL